MAWPVSMAVDDVTGNGYYVVTDNAVKQFLLAGEKSLIKRLRWSRQRFFFEARAVFNFLDLFPFGAFFGQPRSCCSPTPEHEHDHSKDEHNRTPPEVHIQWLRRALTPDEPDKDQEDAKH